MNSDSLPLRSGQALGRYELIAPIAKGGMGQVWAARLRGARGFQKLVAIKTLLASRADDERLERMLFEEARIASLIQHSNVVQTMELGEHDGSLYLVMEWVDGDPLSYLLKACEPVGGLPLLVAVNLVAQTLRGLHAAHDLCDDSGVALGVVHRDVSPHNVLVTYSGVVKLVDFGIAKAMNQQSSSTTTGEIKGKFAYMAPEQILGEEVDQRADLFAVGIMLYLLTSGRHPFKNHESAGVLHSISSEDPVPRPSLVKPGYSRTLEAVVLKALEKRRDNRWSSADEMRLALQRAVPDAFGAEAEAQLRAFLNETLGVRAECKRNALRRAELAAETRTQDSGTLAAVGTSAQSASSLRAVSVDTSADEEQVGRRSHLPTERPLLEFVGTRRRSAKRFGVLAALACCGLIAGFALLRVPAVAFHGASRSTAALSASAPPMLDPVTRPAKVATAASSVVPASPAPALASAVVAPVKPGLHAAKTKPRSTARSAPEPAVPTEKTAPTETLDLIAPDYAR